MTEWKVGLTFCCSDHQWVGHDAAPGNRAGTERSTNVEEPSETRTSWISCSETKEPADLSEEIYIWYWKQHIDES